MKILLYGATGTIGDSVFKIVKNNQSKLRVIAATCNTNYKKLEKLKIKYNIEKLGINNYESAKKYDSLYEVDNTNMPQDIQKFHHIYTYRMFLPTSISFVR